MSDKAFGANEQKIILDSTVNADFKSQIQEASGNNTTDKVFLLSANEALEYFDFDSERKCVATPYSMKENVDKYGCPWWLRTQSGNHRDYFCAVFVRQGGKVDLMGIPVDNSLVLVRPAIWIDLRV